MKYLSALILCLSLLGGCSNSGESLPDGSDAGQDADSGIVYDGSDASDAADASDGRDGPADVGDVDQRPDFDPAQEFVLSIPEETYLCSTLNTARNWEQEFDMLARIDLLHGQYVLPRRVGFVDLDPIAGAQFGPQAETLESDGTPGEIEVERLDLVGDTRWVYTFRKNFLLDGTAVQIEAGFSLDSRFGPWPDLVVFDPEFMSSYTTGMMRIGPGEDHMTEQQTFASCAYPGNSISGHAATASAGDQVVLEMGDCGWSCLGCFGFTVCRFFISAEVTLDGQTRNVTDPFSLVYSAGHHNDGQNFLVVLEPPIGQVAAVLVIEPVTNLYSGELVRLDANLQEISRKDLTGWVNNP
jgi:hypothetical protein